MVLTTGASELNLISGAKHHDSACQTSHPQSALRPAPSRQVRSPRPRRGRGEPLMASGLRVALGFLYKGSLNEHDYRLIGLYTGSTMMGAEANCCQKQVRKGEVRQHQQQ